MACLELKHCVLGIFMPDNPCLKGGGSLLMWSFIYVCTVSQNPLCKVHSTGMKCIPRGHTHTHKSSVTLRRLCLLTCRACERYSGSNLANKEAIINCLYYCHHHIEFHENCRRRFARTCNGSTWMYIFRKNVSNNQCKFFLWVILKFMVIILALKTIWKKVFRMRRWTVMVWFVIKRSVLS
jgi:hypothetical protein